MEAATPALTMVELGPPHIILLPSTGMGHLIPLIEFAKLLVHRHGFTVTVVTVENSPQVDSFLAALPPAVTAIKLPDVSLDDVSPETKIETIICLSLVRSFPSLRTIVAELKATTRLVAFVCDLFSAIAFDVAEEFCVPPYFFFPANAMTFTLFWNLPELDEKTTGEYRDQTELIRLPACIPIHGKDLLDPCQDRTNDAYSWLLHTTRRYRVAKGVIVNSSEGIETDRIRELARPGPGKIPVYAVGPLIQTGSNQVDESECLEWLDTQPAGSVLFVCFGSGGTLSQEQFTELAMGLEMSRQRFLWVTRCPSKNGGAAFFGSKSGNDILGFLPDGFLERTKGVAKVVPSWAPQLEVLKHKAIGSFLSHCGWNSTLETLMHGVPIIAWPLYAEQKMNALMLVEEVKVAIRPRMDESGLIGRDEIKRVVTELMEGDEGKKVRSRVKEVQHDSLTSLEENGSSYVALTAIANKWKSTVTSTVTPSSTSRSTSAAAIATTAAV